jgi:hypothetical protein
LVEKPVNKYLWNRILCWRSEAQYSIRLKSIKIFGRKYRQKAIVFKTWLFKTLLEANCVKRFVSPNTPSSILYESGSCCLFFIRWRLILIENMSFCMAIFSTFLRGKPQPGWTSVKNKFHLCFLRAYIESAIILNIIVVQQVFFYNGV